MKTNVENPLWVNIESVDGAGGSTVLEMVRKRIIEKTNVEPVVVSAIGGGEFGAELREDYLKNTHRPDAGLETAMMILRSYSVVRKALLKGIPVITDRWVPSYYVYNVRLKMDPGAVGIYGNILMNKSVLMDRPTDNILVLADVVEIKSRLVSRKNLDSSDQHALLNVVKIQSLFAEYFTDKLCHIVNNKSDLNSLKLKTDEITDKILIKKLAKYTS